MLSTRCLLEHDRERFRGGEPAVTERDSLLSGRELHKQHMSKHGSQAPGERELKARMVQPDPTASGLSSGYEVVLFDLDGTLIDPRLAITGSVQYALAQLGIVVDDLDRLLPFIGPPLVESFQRYYGLSHAQAIEAVQAYRHAFRERGMAHNQPYPGIDRLLADLHARGVAMAIATSKATVFAEEIAATLGFARWFEMIAGSNLDHTRVAKHEVIAHVLEQRPHYRERSIVMVGDREHDIFGARAHGIDTIAVAYGYGSRQEFDAAAPIAVAETVKHLGELLGAW
jgi:phosphoglycolate phosphatase